MLKVWFRLFKNIIPCMAREIQKGAAVMEGAAEFSKITNLTSELRRRNSVPVIFCSSMEFIVTFITSIPSLSIYTPPSHPPCLAQCNTPLQQTYFF
ncbi:hypothetical protein P8452_72779 [Trifolium repens]|nr:hypothetical protein P8452_72779 [Trifolium repens]